MIKSKYTNLQECCKSDTAIRKGIDNTPNEEQLQAMNTLILFVYEPLCQQYGIKIPFNSFFRSEKVNKLIGGSKTSQHCKGEAIDLDCDTITHKVGNKNLFEHIRNTMQFDQLIWEFGDDNSPAWVHVSFSSEYNKKEVLRAIKVNGKTKYINL